MVSFRKAGNVINVIVLILAITHAVCVVLLMDDNDDNNDNHERTTTATNTSSSSSNFFSFDEQWKQAGFCIQNKDIPFWSSFDIAFYIDTFFSLCLGILYLRWKDQPGMKSCSDVVPFVIIGTLAHGLAHEYEASLWRQEQEQLLQQQQDMTITTTNEEEQKDTTTIFAFIAFGALFWFPLLKACMMNVNSVMVAIMSFCVTMGMSSMDKRYTLTFIQSVLFISFHSNQLLLPLDEKGSFEYLMLPFLSALPTVVTSWIEVIYCTAFYQGIGGHAIYDASIIVSFVLYYISCYKYHYRRQKQQQMESVHEVEKSKKEL